ncbi:NitT/TauT family transport system permease protein [Enhydrobacter aerosaccus]|uniref:NitT/TauT family transport system permease protein n=1 Tax=Enhydrobacter aerosaccus TaxID=225324 RepID=A0A1T4PNX7_9HYPH|nr:ABC transporter permease subunit [Enhydrobacter aerosaccus]SJZ93274.1 NitT/TauT family transport system permease protein [Enhydrobacter aerosaccus]
MTAIAEAAPGRAGALLAGDDERPHSLGLLVVAGFLWLGLGVVILAWPDAQELERTSLLGSLALGFGMLQLLAWAGGWFSRPVARLGRFAPWLVVLALVMTAWEVATAKLDLLPLPFFPSPQAFLEVYTDDWRRLGDSLLHSVLLLARGFAIGAAVGFVIGVALGWSKRVGYWIHPVMRLVGPLPATAWLPLAFFIFPSSGSASTFLIALATAFPLIVLTWSGVAGVQTAYYDVARTLGANSRFLILKVAIPAALPHVFVGLFMGLGSSFAVLVVAEMLGVKSGLGWYLQWAQGWAAYANMYGALLVMALMCSALITVLFRVRDRLLSWQKGLVQW